MQRDSGAPLLEFFAGGGLARLALEPDFACAFANDIDPAKTQAYRAAFGEGRLRVGDIWQLSQADLPGQAALAWASFPCQDLSGARLGTPYWGPFGHTLLDSTLRYTRLPLNVAPVLSNLKLDAVHL